MPDAAIGYRLRPGQSVVYTTREFTTPIATNAQGVRDDAIGPKAAGRAPHRRPRRLAGARGPGPAPGHVHAAAAGPAQRPGAGRHALPRHQCRRAGLRAGRGAALLSPRRGPLRGGRRGGVDLRRQRRRRGVRRGLAARRTPCRRASPCARRRSARCVASSAAAWSCRSPGSATIRCAIAPVTAARRAGRSGPISPRRRPTSAAASRSRRAPSASSIATSAPAAARLAIALMPARFQLDPGRVRAAARRHRADGRSARRRRRDRALPRRGGAARRADARPAAGAEGGAGRPVLRAHGALHAGRP